MLRNSWNVGKLTRMRMQCVPGLPPPRGRPGNEATNDRAQPDRNRERMSDRLTRPILPSGVPNEEDTKLCAADGWIDKGREHVTGTLSKLSG